ncbi:hypothetical protein [Halomicronema sp. CCY15110]|uniref:hypothetical protein n=1 Tax=Halomicronema sp. CCY15110 TaxID=2767773 RepID=UPI00194FF5E6|nr:hypothetical protein [Halomicronema sp. CCY15110]
MLCQTCQRKSDCLPAALAANDTRLYTLLKRLECCDRYLAAKATIPKAPVARRQLLQLITRHST